MDELEQAKRIIQALIEQVEEYSDNEVVMGKRDTFTLKTAKEYVKSGVAFLND
jgi:hypothetical protein